MTKKEIVIGKIGALLPGQVVNVYRSELDLHGLSVDRYRSIIGQISRQTGTRYKTRYGAVSRVLRVECISCIEEGAENV